MRILKYLFLLTLLALFATTVYVGTLKGDFQVERSIVIKSPQATIFNYINDFRNWETFVSWKKEDPRIILNYPKNTVGKGGSYSWSGNSSSGQMKTIEVIPNKKIFQEMVYDGTDASVTWEFKDTIGGTKVTWKTRGTMSFGFKVSSILSGGADHVFGSMYEKSLVNLGKTISFELNTFKIKVNGVVKKTGTFYLKQTITSKIVNVPNNLRILIPRMVHFFAKNKLISNGDPFVIYHTYDLKNGITKLSVCVPVKEEIHISSESDMSCGLQYPFQAVKTTLIGDYSHSKKAWDKTIEYIKKNNLSQNNDIPRIEIYTKNMVQIANPSQWITEIYVPIRTAPAANPLMKTTYQPEKKLVEDSSATTVDENKSP